MDTQVSFYRRSLLKSTTDRLVFPSFIYFPLFFSSSSYVSWVCVGFCCCYYSRRRRRALYHPPDNRNPTSVSDDSAADRTLLPAKHNPFSLFDHIFWFLNSISFSPIDFKSVKEREWIITKETLQSQLYLVDPIISIDNFFDQHFLLIEINRLEVKKKASTHRKQLLFERRRPRVRSSSSKRHIPIRRPMGKLKTATTLLLTKLSNWMKDLLNGHLISRSRVSSLTRRPKSTKSGKWVAAVLDDTTNVSVAIVKVSSRCLGVSVSDRGRYRIETNGQSRATQFTAQVGWGRRRRSRSKIEKRREKRERERKKEE